MLPVDVIVHTMLSLSQLTKMPRKKTMTRRCHMIRLSCLRQSSFWRLRMTS